MRKTFVLIFTVALLSAFANNYSTAKDHPIRKTAFEQFVDSIPLLELPFELSTTDVIKHVPLNSPYIPEGAALIGKLKSQNNRWLIIYSYPADIRLPILEVYDSNGKKLSEVQLFDYGNCPVTSSGYSKFVIKNEKEIYKETACDAYDSRTDRDTINIEGLLKND
jgi:hypothetical protein